MCIIDDLLEGLIPQQATGEFVNRGLIMKEKIPKNKKLLKIGTTCITSKRDIKVAVELLRVYMYPYSVRGEFGDPNKATLLLLLRKVCFPHEVPYGTFSPAYNPYMRVIMSLKTYVTCWYWLFGLAIKEDDAIQSIMRILREQQQMVENGRKPEYMVCPPPIHASEKFILMHLAPFNIYMANTHRVAFNGWAEDLQDPTLPQRIATLIELVSPSNTGMRSKPALHTAPIAYQSDEAHSICINCMSDPCEC